MPKFWPCGLPRGRRKLTRHFVVHVIVEKSASFSVVMSRERGGGGGEIGRETDGENGAQR